MSYTKKKFALWLTPETKELVERCYQLDNSQSQSEFIERAIQFYTGYHAKIMSVENHDMAHDTDATLDELEQLRGRCVKAVMRTHGMISFKEIFRFQKRL